MNKRYALYKEVPFFIS